MIRLRTFFFATPAWATTGCWNYPQLVRTGQSTFPEPQCFETRFGDSVSVEPSQVAGVPINYSARNACIGSRREARQAGARQAVIATSNSNPATAANTAGSIGCVWYRIERMSFASNALAVRPAIRPASAGPMPSKRTLRSTCSRRFGCRSRRLAARPCRRARQRDQPRRAPTTARQTQRARSRRSSH